MTAVYQECSALFEAFIAGSISLLIAGILVILALSFSKLWLVGLAIVPPIYYLALQLSEIAFLFLTLFTLGLPLLFCL